MVYRTAVRASYDAALYIPGEAGPAARTHGHRYTVEAVLESEGTDRSGFVVDFDLIQPQLIEIAAELDHRLLNELEPFRDRAPSAENQAERIYRRLSRRIREQYGAAVRLVKVRVTQEPGAWAEYEA